MKTRLRILVLAPVISVTAAAAFGQSASFATVDLAGSANSVSKEVLAAVGQPDWFLTPASAPGGIAFHRLGGGRDVVATPAGVSDIVVIPVNRSAVEAYLWMGAILPRTGRGARQAPLRAVQDPERLLIRVKYQDGVEDSMFPVRVASGKYEVVNGADVYALPALRRSPIASLGLECRMTSGRILLAGVVLNTGIPLVHPPAISTLPDPVPERPLPFVAPSVRIDGNAFVLETRSLGVSFQTSKGVTITSLRDKALRGGDVRLGNTSLFEIGVGEKLITSDRVRASNLRRQGNSILVDVDGRPEVPLSGALRVTPGASGEILMSLDLRNASPGVLMPVVNFPAFSRVALGTVSGTWYFYGKQGGIINQVPARLRQQYSGRYPMQVTGLFNPDLGGGLYLVVHDLQNIYKSFVTDKNAEGVDWRIEYYPREYAPGEKLEIAETALGGNTGDWRAQLAAYSRWAETWRKPLVARKDWFRDVYNYRQHFVWQNAEIRPKLLLYDSATQTYHPDDIASADKAFFGYLDYLHIFDFGRSAVYGRVGDYSHYDEIGGREKLARAIAGLQDSGVPVGLYIEGYLVDDRGVWGSQHVQEGHILRQNGQPLWFGGDRPSHEHMMCPAWAPWQDYLADVYRRVAAELKPKGMYIDQNGFGDERKLCWSRNHGHPVPAAPIRGEFELGRKIRLAAPEQIATLTEEVPTDVTSQVQDGALSYSVLENDPQLAPHRVDLFHFVFPDFKIFQLTSYAPYVEGNWGVLKYPFFNGEGWWLSSPIPEGMEPAARDFMRTALRVLHQHLAAFRTDTPEPLVRSMSPLVFANLFPSGNESVWTLFNADYRSYHGPVLEVEHVRGALYMDAWNDIPLTPVLKGNRALLSAALGPRGVGCIVQIRPKVTGHSMR